MSTAPKIAPNHPFLNSEVILNISNGVTETLRTMAGVESDFEHGFVEKNWKSPTELSVYLNLQSEPYVGQIRFHFQKNVLVELYKKMVDEGATPDATELVDCLGEISNMCYGYAKGKLNEKGFSLKMTTPYPGYTQNLPEVYSRHPHIIIPFKVFNQTSYIQVIIF